jgi:hypothetical protein
MSAADTVSDKLKELIEISIADETRYLKTYDKFIWMRAMEGDFLDMIEKWREIFGTFEYMVHQECDRRINEIYREPYADGEKTIEQIMGERVQYYLETCYKEELENLQNEETELKERWKPGHDFIMQRYHHSSSDFLEKNFANMEKVAKIEVRLREIGERRDKIECMCQEIAYDELFGADEKNPVPNMEKPEILLKKAISEVEENYKA